jgi:hypothetical protein
MKLLTTLLLSAAIAFISCSNGRENKNSEPIRFQYVHGSAHYRITENIDSLDLSEMKLKLLYSRHVPVDSERNYVLVKKFTNAPVTNAPGHADGKHLAFWEKSVGILYITNQWRAYTRLKSSNDSINDFICTLIAQVGADPDLYLPPPAPGSEYKIP